MSSSGKGSSPEDKELKDVAWICGLFAVLFALLIRYFSVTTFILPPIAAFVFHQFYWRRRNLPPGPVPLPLIGNTLSIDMRNPAKTFSSWHALYGPIYTVWLPHPMIVMASHEVLKEALIRQGPAFAGRPSGYIWSMFTKNPEHGDGIILCEGERWEHIREFAHKIFRNFGLGRTQMEEKIMDNINYMIAHIDGKLQGNKKIALDLDEPISLCVANIIQDFVLGKSYEFGDPQFRKFKSLIDAVLADVASKPVQLVNAYPILAYLPIPALRRYKENGFALQRYFLNVIREHKDRLQMDGEPRDFMEAFLREMALQRDNPHFNEFTLALASGDLWTGGMETTVTTLRWGFAYLLYHPSVQKKCYNEIYQVFGDEQPCYARRKQLPYVEATIAELQRITNVLPWAIPHRTTEDVELLGFRLPKGTVVLPQYGTVHHDSRYFPEPEKFKPERFLDGDGCFKRRPEMNPFGMGKRTCLGENLARYELFLLLTTLIQKYEFLPIEGEPLPSLQRSLGITNVPMNYKCMVVPRKPSVAV
ncbi:hypothetical protein V3C99_013232 [Haemonchus contortus]